MLDTAAAGETGEGVGPFVKGEVRGCKALYAIAEVDDDSCLAVEHVNCRTLGADVPNGLDRRVAQDQPVRTRFSAISLCDMCRKSLP